MSHKTKYGINGTGKLVRDKVITILEKRNIRYASRIAASDDEKINLLQQKFQEEYKELNEHEEGDDPWRLELVDVHDVIGAMVQMSVARRLVVPTCDARMVTKDFHYSQLNERLLEAYNELNESQPFESDWLMALATMSNIVDRFIHADGAYRFRRLGFQKIEEKGGFEKGVVLLWTEETQLIVVGEKSAVVAA